MLKIQIIVGSTRPGRNSRGVADWYLEQVKGTVGAEFEIVDLAEINLPMYDEPVPPKANKYENEHAKKWSAKIAEADGYVWVAPEYNHAMPGVLKNAIDYLYYEWNKKPVAFVSYGSVGGARAVENMRLVAAELQMVPIAPSVHMVGYYGGPIPDGYEEPAQAVTAELVWWGNALQTARQGIKERVE